MQVLHKLERVCLGGRKVKEAKGRFKRTDEFYKLPSVRINVYIVDRREGKGVREQRSEVRRHNLRRAYQQCFVLSGVDYRHTKDIRAGAAYIIDRLTSKKTLKRWPACR